jgi:uncharacterized membrane protein
LHLEVTRFVRAPPETVYAAYTDFEAMPKWSKRLKAVKVTKREGDTVHLESEGVSSNGRPRKTEGTLRLTPPNKVQSESETRFTRSKRTVAFEAAPEAGTRVTATLDVEVKGLWGVVLRTGVKKDVAESSATEELASFATFVESSNP